MNVTANIKNEYIKIISEELNLLREVNKPNMEKLLGTDLMDPEKSFKIILDINKTPEEIYDEYFEPNLHKLKFSILC